MLAHPCLLQALQVRLSSKAGTNDAETLVALSVRMADRRMGNSCANEEIPRHKQAEELVAPLVAELLARVVTH